MFQKLFSRFTDAQILSCFQNLADCFNYSYRGDVKTCANS